MFRPSDDPRLSTHSRDCSDTYGLYTGEWRTFTRPSVRLAPPFLSEIVFSDSLTVTLAVHEPGVCRNLNAGLEIQAGVYMIPIAGNQYN